MSTFPRLMWADSGESRQVMAEMGPGEFVWFVGRDGVWRSASESMTAAQATDYAAYRRNGWWVDWPLAGHDLAAWLESACAELTGTPS